MRVMTANTRVQVCAVKNTDASFDFLDLASGGLEEARAAQGGSH